LFRNSAETHLVWLHASGASLENIRDVAEKLTYQISSADPTDPGTLMSLLGDWYHTMVQGSFFMRGSAAITQWLFVTLCRLKEITPPPAMKNLDCYALSVDRETFKREVFYPWFQSSHRAIAKSD
jgi:hypothetical protein